MDLFMLCIGLSVGIIIISQTLGFRRVNPLLVGMLMGVPIILLYMWSPNSIINDANITIVNSTEQMYGLNQVHTVTLLENKTENSSLYLDQSKFNQDFLKWKGDIK